MEHNLPEKTYFIQSVGFRKLIFEEDSMVTIHGALLDTGKWLTIKWYFKTTMNILFQCLNAAGSQGVEMIKFFGKEGFPARPDKLVFDIEKFLGHILKFESYYFRVSDTVNSTNIPVGSEEKCLFIHHVIRDEDCRLEYPGARFSTVVNGMMVRRTITREMQVCKPLNNTVSKLLDQLDGLFLSHVRYQSFLKTGMPDADARSQAFLTNQMIFKLAGLYKKAIHAKPADTVN